MATLAESREKYTYQDYAKLSEGAPYQLINGELVMTPAPTTYHQRLAREIFLLLASFVKLHGLGEIFFSPLDVYFSETETYQPDIIYVSKDRLSIIAEEKVEGSPDLIAEILSPTTAYYDLRHKKQVYEQYGVKEYWIVDPMEKSIEVYENKKKSFELFKKYDRTGTLRSPLLEGLNLDLSKVF